MIFSKYQENSIVQCCSRILLLVVSFLIFPIHAAFCQGNGGGGGGGGSDCTIDAPTDNGSVSGGDACNDAIDLGSLDGSCSCGGETVVPDLYSGDNNGATAENPYTTQAGCNQASPAADVWYQVTVTDPQFIVDINNSTMNETNVSVWNAENGCGGLTGIGCAVDTDNDGNLTDTIEAGITSGTDVFIQVSGGSESDSGTFDMTLTNTMECEDCMQQYTFTASPTPTQGTYQPGETVEYCLTIDHWQQTNTNWFSGMSFDFGSGWDAGSFNTTNIPATIDGDGTYSWFNNVAVRDENGNVINTVDGIFYDDGDGDPSNNFGDNFEGDVSLTFCWEMTVSSSCTPGGDLSMSVNTYADGEVGSWSDPGCITDAIPAQNAVMSCCDFPLTDSIPTCPGFCEGSATVEGQGVGPWDYVWEDSGGNQIASDNNLNGPSTLNGLCPGTYTVEVTDDNNCTKLQDVTVTEYPVIDLSATPTDPTCASNCDGSIDLTASGGAGTSTPLSYSWTGPSGFTSTNEDISSLCPGTYEVMVTDSAGCQDSLEVTLNVPNALSVTASTDQHETCAGDCDGAVSAAGSGGTTPYSYSWDDGSTGSSVSGLCPGQYIVTITDDNGCTAEDTTVIDPGVDITANVPTVPGQCLQGNSFSFDGSGSTISSGSITSYSWDFGDGNTGSGSSVTHSYASAGTYTACLTVSDGTCTDDSCITVEVYPHPQADIPLPDTITCAQPSVTVDASGSATSHGPLSYNWSTTGGNITSGTTNSSITVDEAGSYSVVVTDTNGCTDDSTVTVEIDTIPPQAVVAPPDTLTCAVTSVTLDGSGSTSNSGNHTYSWSNGATNATTSVSTGGSYTLTITDQENGCADDTTVVVEVDTISPDATVAPPDTFFCSTSAVTLDAAGSWTNSGVVDYSWTAISGNIISGSSTASADVDQPGDYQITITDPENGCTDDTTVTVVQDANTPTASVAPPDTLTCVVTTVTLDGTGSSTNSGNINYSWNTSGGNITGAAADSSTIDVDAAGNYTLTVTDPDNGCTMDTTVMVEIDTIAPDAVVGTPDTLTCTNTSVTLDGSGSTSNSGNHTYSWSNGATTATTTVSSPGNYTLTVTDPDNGCVDDTTVTVIADTVPPSPSIPLPDTITCTTTSVTLDGSGSTTANNATQYSWSTGDNTATTTVSSGGSYTLTVTDTMNGCVEDSTVTVVVDTVSPDAFVAEPDTFYCTTTSVTLDGSGSSSNSGSLNYSWSSGGTNATETVTASGSYTLTVTDPENGCVDDTTVTVPQDNNTPTVNIAPVDTLTCAMTTITVDASGSTTNSGNIDFSWNTSSGNIIGAAGDSSTIDVDAGADYTVTVTDPDNGCTSSQTVTVEQDTVSPHAVVATPDTLTCSVTSVSLDGSGSTSNSGNLNYSWSSGGTSATESVSNGGSYTLTVTDPANGCTDDTTIVVEQDTVSPTPVVAAPDTLTCTTTSVTIDGSASTTANNATQYSWSTGDNTATTDVTAGGNYTLTITDTVNGCTDDTTVTVIQDTIDPQAVVAEPDTFFCTTDSVTLDGSGSTSSSGNLSYSWTAVSGNIISGSNTSMATVDQAGDYQLVVTDPDNGCTHDTTITVPQDNNIPVATIATPDTLTCVTTVVTVDASSSTTSSGNKEYSWSTSGGNIVGAAADSSTIDVDTPGGYTVTVTDPSNGCTSSKSVTVQQDTISPHAVVATPDTLTCATTNVTMDGSGSTSNSGDLNYSWSTGGTNATESVSSGGSYTLTVTDPANGCTDDTTITVIQDTVAPDPVVATPDTLTCATTSVTIDGSASSTANNATQYSWSTGDMTSTTTVTAGGNYTLTITDTVNGCVDDTTVTVIQDTIDPTIAVAPIDTLSCTDTIVTVDAGGSFTSSGSIAYSWSTPGGNILNGTNADTIQVDASGDYMVTVTDPENGCTHDTTVTVEQDESVPVVDIAEPDTFFCNTVSITLNGAGSSTSSGNIDFSWSPISGNIISGGNTASADADQPGSYSLTVTDPDNGCSATDTVTVHQDTAHPVISVLPPDTLTCNVLSVNVDASGSTTNSGDIGFNWGTTNGNITSGTFSSSIDVDAGGDYDLTVTDNYNGCTSDSTIPVIQDTASPNPVVATPDTLTCAVTTITVDGSGSTTNSGGIQYSWSTPGGNIISGASNASIDVDQPGDYTLTITDTYSGCTDDTTVTVEQNIVQPTANVAAPDTFFCTTTSVFLDGSGSSSNSGNVDYNWSAVSGNILNGSTTASPEVDQSGDYQLIVTDPGNGCTDTVVVTVPQDTNLPVADAGNDTIIPCDPKNFFLDGSGSTSGSSIYYNWTTTGGNFIGGSTTDGPEIDQSGTYTITVTDSSNNCQATDQVVVSDPPPLTYTVSINDLSCYNDSTGQILISASGGSGNYQYSIDSSTTFQSDSAFTNLDGGVYDIYVEDDWGCVNTSVDTVEEPSELVINYFSVDSVDCYGACDGGVTAFPAGGTAVGPYSFYWSNNIGDTTQAQPSNVCAGNYYLEIQDDNGCSVDTNFSVEQPDPYQVWTSQDGAHCYQADGSAMVDSVAGANPPYSYQWDAAAGNQTTDSAISLSPGTYDVTISDANGCDTIVSVTVHNIEGPIATIIDSTDAICNGDCNGMAEVEGSNGGGPYSYQWNDPNNQTSTAANGLCAGTYEAVVTDQFNCPDTATVTIDEPAQVTVNTFDDTTICINDTATLGAMNPSGGTPGYSFNWTGVDSGRVQTVAPGSTTTSYEVIATDTNGCASAPATMTVSFHPGLDVTAYQDDSICPGESVGINAVSNGGGDGNYSYSWSNGDNGSNITVAPMVDSTYVVELSDGCTSPPAFDSVHITVMPVPEPTFSANNTSGCKPVEVTFTNTTDSAMVGGNCTWTFGNSNSQASGCDSVSHVFTQAGEHDIGLSVTSPFGCVGDTVYPEFINAYNYPVADFSASPQPTTILDSEIDFTNLSMGATQYEWNFGELDTSSEEHPTYVFPNEEQGTYPVCLKAISTYGCPDSVCKDVTIEGEFVLYVPNSFTPDGDGKNDEFFPVVQGHKESEFTFLVYNRWGEKIFESHHSDNHWDGTFKGRVAKEDVYVWQVIAVDKYSGKKVEKKGHVTLLR